MPPQGRGLPADVTGYRPTLPPDITGGGVTGAVAPVEGVVENAAGGWNVGETSPSLLLASQTPCAPQNNLLQ